MYKPCSKFEGKFETQKAVFLCNDGLGHPGQFVYIRDDREEQEYFGLCEVEVFEYRSKSHLNDNYIIHTRLFHYTSLFVFAYFIIHDVSKIYGQCYFWFLRASFFAERTDSSPFSLKVHHHHLSVKQPFLYSWPRSAKVKGRLAAMIEKAPLANLSAEIVSGPFDVVVDHKCKKLELFQ